jgi:hypothetical protein
VLKLWLRCEEGGSRRGSKVAKWYLRFILTIQNKAHRHRDDSHERRICHFTHSPLDIAGTVCHVGIHTKAQRQGEQEKSCR